MASYVSLGRWTDKGIANFKESPKRLDAVKELLKDNGGKLSAFYLVTGAYDFVAVFDVPDDQTMARIALMIGSQGNVRTESLRAFSEDEYRKIIGAM